MDRRTFVKLAGLVMGGGVVGLGCQRAGAEATVKEDATMSKTVKIKAYNKKGELVGPIESARVVKTDEEWKKQLTADQFKVARAKGTERPFCGTLLDNHEKGIYTCICCGLPLFSSEGKFTSGTGWPSFFEPVAKENVLEHRDESYGMARVEILCARCDCHLGHVFEDGPRPTGLRFCVNSESLSFTSAAKVATLADPITETPAAPTTKPVKP